VGGIAPVDGDAFVIANTHVVTFDMDQSAWAGMAASTINAGGTLLASTTAGAYVLKMNGADLTVNGTLQAGTSVAVPYPSTCAFTINFSNTAKSIEVAAGGHLYLYCAQPTNKYITITEAGGIGEGTVADPLNVDTNVTADWAVGQTIAIVDSTPIDVEYFALSAINAGSLEIGAVGLAAAKSANSIAVLITRNIRIINVAASDYAITYANNTTSGNGDYIGAELYQTSKGINLGIGYNFSGTANPLTTSTSFITNPYTSTISGSITGNNTATSFIALSNAYDTTVSGLIAGCYSRGISTGYSVVLSGRVFGCATGDYGGGGNTLSISSAGKIDYCAIGIQDRPYVVCFGEISNNGTGIYRAAKLLLAGTLGNTTYDLRAISTGSIYSTAFGGGTEFYEYANLQRLISDYVESFDHNGTASSFKAWCRGGIVTSQTASPPTGYTIYYTHACEDTATEYPCFRQYETTVPAGQTIEVSGYLKIPAVDFTAVGETAPRLQIIDKFADPLVDSTQTSLDEDVIPVANGTNTAWQAVSVLWANSGAAPRQVIVRMLCYSHTSGNTDISEAWAVADYQDQIAAIYAKLPTNYIMGSSDVDNHDTDIDAILLDTNEMQGKLPTNNIMGSSVKTDKDDEIVEILDRAKRIGLPSEF
jgi:hypothetical protein